MNTKTKQEINLKAFRDVWEGRIAAAALYVSALIHGEKRTQREVADIAGITEVTIRNRYKELIEKLNLEEKIKQKEAESKKKKNEK